MPARKSGPMSETMPQDLTGLAVMVGEMRGQMREAIHTLNNVSAKIDGLSREVVAMGPLAAEIAEIKGELKLAQVEIGSLKSDRDRRTGATNLAAWVIRNWPGVLGFLLLVGIILRSNGVKL